MRAQPLLRGLYGRVPVIAPAVEHDVRREAVLMPLQREPVNYTSEILWLLFGVLLKLLVIPMLLE